MISGRNRAPEIAFWSSIGRFGRSASWRQHARGLPCDQSHGFPGSAAPALLRYATYAVRECVAALQRCVPFPTRVNCGSSRKGVTHQSVLGHISGCRLQNCCSAVDFKTAVLHLVLRISSAADFKTAESPNYYFIGNFHAKAGHAPRVILVLICSLFIYF